MARKTQFPDDESPESSQDRDPWLELKRIEKIPEVIAREMLREIVNRKLQPGDTFPAEAVISKRFGVGRASMREALRILEVHGIIRIKPGPGGGPMVKGVNSDDYGRTNTIFLHSAGATFRELLEARLVVEPVMARLAAERLTEESAARLRAATKSGWDALDEPDEVFAAAIEDFHLAMAGVSQNRVLDIFSLSLVSIHRTRVATHVPHGERKAALKVHDRIAQAILNGEAKQAEQLAHRHLKELGEAIERWIPLQMDEVIDWR